MSAPLVQPVSPGPLGGSSRELHVETLLGYKLCDSEGRALGRIEEIIAEIAGTDWVVREVHLGRGALIERLIEISTIVPFFGFVQRRANARYRLRWDQLDFTDPTHPRATVRREELRKSSE